jgi:hypothetical protein
MHATDSYYFRQTLGIVRPSGPLVSPYKGEGKLSLGTKSPLRKNLFTGEDHPHAHLNNPTFPGGNTAARGGGVVSPPLAKQYQFKQQVDHILKTTVNSMKTQMEELASHYASTITEPV